MKLAEALANRADLQRRIEQMRGRLQKSALVQEGESPPEDPQELLEETERLVSELEGYLRRINRTNLAAALADAHGRPEAQDGRTGPQEARARHRHPAGRLGDRSHGRLSGALLRDSPVLQQVTHVFAGGGERRERRRLSKQRRITDWLQKPGSRAVPGRYRGGSSPRIHRRAQHL